MRIAVPYDARGRSIELVYDSSICVQGLVEDVDKGARAFSRYIDDSLVDWI